MARWQPRKVLCFAAGISSNEHLFASGWWFFFSWRSRWFFFFLLLFYFYRWNTIWAKKILGLGLKVTGFSGYVDKWLSIVKLDGMINSFFSCKAYCRLAGAGAGLWAWDNFVTERFCPGSMGGFSLNFMLCCYSQEWNHACWLWKTLPVGSF